jgi:hypothetical protein
VRALIAVACLLFSAAGSTACLTVSLHPAYDDHTLEFDERLLGKWTSHDDHLVAEVERGEWQSYRVRLTDDRRVITVIARLTRIGPARFVDVMAPGDPAAHPLAVMVHTVCRVEIDDHRLSVVPLDYDAVSARLKHGRLGIEGAFDDRQNVVLTAATPALRRWLAQDGPRAAPAGAAMTFSRAQEE